MQQLLLALLLTLMLLACMLLLMLLRSTGLTLRPGRRLQPLCQLLAA
jgi:hypothetical protein